MKVAILAGGLGTRLSEQTEITPKPLVEIGEEPILWHIMKHYEHFGFNEFVLALGYKGEMIKRYFMDRCRLNGYLKVSMASGAVEITSDSTTDWTVHLVDTGATTQTGGRLKRLAPYVADGTFMLTYGDGVSNVDIQDLARFHRQHGRLATITAVRPPPRFGGLELEGSIVTSFSEKSPVHAGWINGGFMVLEPGVLDYLHGDGDGFESVALEELARDGELAAYRHEGFWHPMDTLRDVRELQSLWQSGEAPWRLWA